MMKEVLKRARELVRPEEEEEKRLKEVEEAVGKRLDRFSEVEWVIGGSYAHDTWLPGEADIDVFLLFPQEMDVEEISEKGLEIAGKVLEPYRPRKRYAEHPYLEAFVKGVRVNIVPCASVKDGRWKTAADRSPYHTLFLKRVLTEELKLEVRLLKKFLKVQGLYGAEIRVRGFSGYLTEVLTVKYGSFLNLLKGASSWRKGEVIAFEEEERVRRIHRGSWLIIADPVDPTRNLATALSPQKVAKFILLSRSFLDRPHLSYFTEFKGWRDEPMYDNVVCLRFKVPAKVEDILWGELLKSAKAVAKQLKIKGFEVIKYSIACEEGEACIALLLERTEKRFLVRRGPEVFIRQDAERFLGKHRKDILVWVDEDMRLYSFAENERSEVDDVLMEMGKDPVSYGIAKGIASNFGKTLEVLRGEEMVVKEGVTGEALKCLVREGSSVKG